MQIKNIIFDIGNVFIYWDPYRLYKNHFKTKEETDAFFKETNFWQMVAELDKGADMAQTLHHAATKHPHYAKQIKAFDEQWLETLAGAVEGTFEMMLELKEKGYGVYGLSNFVKEKFEVTANIYDFPKHFDGIIVSGHVKQIKPQEDIYKTLLSKYGLKARECVFLDDRADNIETAHKLGFKTILFTNCAAARKDLKRLGVDL